MVFTKGHKINIGRIRPEHSMKIKELHKKGIYSNNTFKSGNHYWKLRKRSGKYKGQPALNKGIRTGTFENCTICNKEFYKYPSSYRKCCSLDCAYKDSGRSNKLREARLKEIINIRGRIFPNIGKQEIQILDEISKLIGYKVLRQYQIKNYFLDGYISELNLAIEVDERPKNNEKDIEREQEIKQNLNCEFLRIPTYKESKDIK